MDIKNLSKEDLNKIKDVLLMTCRDYEPWADMMMLGGAGDLGDYDFPFDLDQIESIEITVGGSQESGTGSPDVE